MLTIQCKKVLDVCTGWFNRIDEACRNIKSGETHGLMIGPHASNLIAEIILIVVDKRLLDKGWKFVRNIDDYNCYVRTYEEAQTFLRDLGQELRNFDLSLNHKKTIIEELPRALTSDWVRQLSAVTLIAPFGKVGHNQAQAFLNLAIKLAQDSGMNSAVLNYALKTLSNHPLTKNAKELCTKMAMHLSVIYPYLLPLMQKHVFEPYGTDKNLIIDFANLIYSDALKADNYEAACYAILFSLNYHFKLNSISPNDMILKDNCLFKLFGQIYFKRNGTQLEKNKFRDHAKSLQTLEMDRYWPFVFETLSHGNLKEDWKPLKKAGISFLLPEYQ